MSGEKEEHFPKYRYQLLFYKYYSLSVRAVRCWHVNVNISQLIVLVWSTVTGTNRLLELSGLNYIKCIGLTTKTYAEIISEYVVIGRLSLWIVFKQIQSSQLTNSRKCSKLDYCTLSTCNRCSILTLRIHRYIDKVNTVYYLLCLRRNSFTLFVGKVVDVFLCVAIIKQTIPSVGLGLLILGFPRIADNLTWCNLTIYFIYHI